MVSAPVLIPALLICPCGNPGGLEDVPSLCGKTLCWLLWQECARRLRRYSMMVFAKISANTKCLIHWYLTCCLSEQNMHNSFVAICSEALDTCVRRIPALVV